MQRCLLEGGRGRGGEEARAGGVEASGGGGVGERINCPGCGKDFTRRGLPHSASELRGMSTFFIVWQSAQHRLILNSEI